MSAAGPAGVSVQKRISDQRQRLLALDYHDPFTAESLALVERLFEDLITTTESYEDLQQREDQTAAELALSRAQLFPLKKENARLLRDNNLLHLKVIKAAEDASRAERSFLLLERRADAEREQNRCLGAQKDLRISDLEKQVEQLRTSLAGALDSAAATQDGLAGEGEGAARAALRRTGMVQGLNGLEREMEVSNALPAMSRSGGMPGGAGMRSSASRRYDADGLGPEDERLSEVVETLQARLEEASLSFSGMEEERARLERQVEVREEEIARLGRQIGSDSNLEKVTLAHAHEANQRIVEQLNDQVDFLNRQLANREAELSEVRQESSRKGGAKPMAMAATLEVARLQALARTMEEDNARLSKRAAELEDSIAAADADVPANGMANSGGEGQGQQDGWEVVGEGEHDRARLEEALVETKKELLKAATAAGEAAADAERLRRHVQSVEGEVARLQADAETRSASLDRLSREREELLEKLQASAKELESTEGKAASGAAREAEAEGRLGEEARRRRATTERLSVVQEQTEFLAEEAESAKARESAAAGRAAAAEARAAGAKLDAETLERALRAEARRARGVEGEAANAREAEAAAEGLRERMEGLRERLEASETARDALSDELERLAGRGSLLGVEHLAQSSRVSALEREAAGLSADLKARENDVATLLQQKRALEDEVSRAQRALSRGAVETASMAQGELALQARVEEATDDVRGLRSEVGRLTDALLAEERKTVAARDEADRLATRLSHRSAGFEGLESELASLRGQMAVARAEATEREGVCARMEAEAERARSSLEALEQQVMVSREALSDKDEEIRRLKALARQLEGSRETLKASGDEVHAALRDAELRVGQALSSGDAAKRDAEASRAEVAQFKNALSELDSDRDRLQDTLDKQSENLAALRSDEERWRSQVEEAEDRLREEGSRCSDLERALEAAERRANEASGDVLGGLQKTEALSSALEKKTRQLAAATEDLEMMAKENQAVTAEVTRLVAERDDGRRKLGDALHNQATAEQGARAAQFEKGDVLKNYRGLHAEKRRLEAGVDELQLTRQRLTKSLAERDAEVSKLRSSITGLEVELQRKTVDLGAVQRQAENLSAQLLRGGRQVEALAAENRRLVADARAQRHHANALLERIRTQQGHSTTAGQEVITLRARLQALEEERDGLSHILGRERSHGSGLEQLIEASRLREASVAAEQRQLAKEKERLETKAAKLEEELTQARDCLADMSSRMSVSMSASRRGGGGGEQDTSSSTSNGPGTPSTPASSSNMLELSPSSVHFAPRLASSGGAGGGSGGGVGALSLSGLGGDGRRGVSARPAAVTAAEEWRARHLQQNQQQQEQEQRGGGEGGRFSGGSSRGGDGGEGQFSGGGRDGVLMGQQQQQQQEQHEREGRGRSSSSSESLTTTTQTESAVYSRRGSAPLPSTAEEKEDEAGGGGSGGGAVREEARRQQEGVEGEDDEDSGVFDLEDVRGFVRRESERLRESVRAGRTAGALV